MDTLVFEVMRLCSLSHDKEMNMINLFLKLLELSVIICSELKDPKTPITSNTNKSIKYVSPPFSYFLLFIAHLIPILATDEVDINQNRINERWSSTKSLQIMNVTSQD